MNYRTHLTFMLAVCGWLAMASLASAEKNVQNLKIGDPAPDFALPGIDGKTHRLADYQQGKILMVIFISNHCPTSHANEGRLRKLMADTRSKGVTFVAINPNHPDGLSIDELGYSKYGDSFEDMKKYAA